MRRSSSTITLSGATLVTSCLAAVCTNVRVRLRCRRPSRLNKRPDTARILAFCLTGRIFPLQRERTLCCFRFANLVGQAADKRFGVVGIDGNQDVGFTTIHADGMHAFGIGQGKRHRDAAKQPSFALNHRHAVEFHSRGEHRLEVRGHGVADALAPGNRPDRQRTVCSKVGVPATLANQEQRRRTNEAERARGRLAVPLGRCIGSRNHADSADRELAGYRAFDGLVGGALQRQRAKRCAVVVAPGTTPA